MTLAKEEIRIIHQALNEVCNGIHFDDDEFETRLGTNKETAVSVMVKFLTLELYNRRMDWSKFEPADFEYDFERDELFAHRITLNEAIECFYSEFVIRRNKSFVDRFQLIGETFGGRKLKLIFQLKSDNIVRIITGWDI